MPYNIYQDDELIAENVEEKSYVVTGLTPDTVYTFGVSEVIGNKESSKVTATVKTKAIRVENIEMSPKNMNAIAGTAGSRSLRATVSPENASNPEVEYYISTQVEGLTVSSNGALEWTSDVPSGEYQVVARALDNNLEAVSTLTLSEPEPVPEPEPEPEPEEE